MSRGDRFLEFNRCYPRVLFECSLKGPKIIKTCGIRHMRHGVIRFPHHLDRLVDSQGIPPGNKRDADLFAKETRKVLRLEARYSCRRYQTQVARQIAFYVFLQLAQAGVVIEYAAVEAVNRHSYFPFAEQNGALAPAVRLGLAPSKGPPVWGL